jgi:hypothetical protein
VLTQYEAELEWRAESHQIAGAEFELRTDRLRALVAWTFTQIDVDGADVVYRWKVGPSISDLTTNRQRTLVRARLPYGIRAGEGVRIRMRIMPDVYAGVDLPLSIWTRPGITGSNWGDAPEPEPIREEASRCSIELEANVAERFRVYCRPAPGPTGTVRAVLSPQDRFGNPTAFANPVPVRVEWAGETFQREITGPESMELPAPSAVARARAALALSALSADETIQNGVLDGEEVTVLGNPVWPESIDGLRPAFGEFHWHTDFSGDGQRPLDEALQSARDLLNHDFTAPGDHNPKGEAWTRTVEALEAYNDEGTFATFFGWENGSSIGHENYYFTRPDHPVRCDGGAGVVGGGPIANEANLDAQEDFFAVPHHTNAVAETRRLEDDAPYWHPYPWGEPKAYRRLAEICQARGNQERNVYSDAWRGWHQHNGASVQDALATGHRLGFTGGTDNHCGWPGRAYCGEAIGRIPPWSEILTGVWTPALTRTDIYQSLHARHTWVVWDTRAIVHFTINGVLGGGELSLAAGDALTAHLRIAVESPLRLIELVSEGTVLWRDKRVALDVDESVALDHAASSTHIYLRALTRDGGVIYASPVFIDVA